MLHYTCRQFSKGNSHLHIKVTTSTKADTKCITLDSLVCTYRYPKIETQYGDETEDSSHLLTSDGKPQNTYNGNSNKNFLDSKGWQKFLGKDKGDAGTRSKYQADWLELFENWEGLSDADEC